MDLSLPTRHCSTRVRTMLDINCTAHALTCATTIFRTLDDEATTKQDCCHMIYKHMLPSLHHSCSQNSLHWKLQPQGTKVLLERNVNNDWLTNKATTIERSYVDIFGASPWVVTYCPCCNVKRSDGHGRQTLSDPTVCNTQCRHCVFISLWNEYM